MDVMPNLDFKAYYPSLDDIKPVEYQFCSTPQNRDDADLKQIKSQTYSTDILADLFGAPQQQLPQRTSDLTMSTQETQKQTSPFTCVMETQKDRTTSFD